jgi:hypothetical protein
MPNPEFGGRDYLPQGNNPSNYTDGQQCMAYLYAMYGRYVGLPWSDELRISMRCLLPKWYKPHITRREEDASWFPLTHAGLRQAARYIKLNRDNFEIYNGIHPTWGERRDAESIRAVSVLGIDLDAKGDKGGAGAARSLVNQRMREGVFPPHFITQGRNGLHLYYMLDAIVLTDTRDAVEKYRELYTRLCLAVNGPKDALDENNRKVWSGPTADDNVRRLESTLRPAGSFNHGSTPADKPVLIRIVHYRPDFDWYGWNWLCQDADMPYPKADMPDVSPALRVRLQREAEGFPPHMRKKIPYPTRNFLNTAHLYSGADRHLALLRAVSDLNFSNYTREETLDIIVKYASGGNAEDRTISDMVYKSPGKSFDYWNECALPEGEITI